MVTKIVIALLLFACALLAYACCAINGNKEEYYVYGFDDFWDYNEEDEDDDEIED